MDNTILSKHGKTLSELESIIGYTFKDKSKLMLALTHSSYANEKKRKGLLSNERIEFLGDAVLNILTSSYIYNRYTSLSEGEMTKLRASIVCESSLAKYAQGVNLGDFIFLGKGEDSSGGRNRPSIISDAFEALIGAIYLDGGINEARNFVLDTVLGTSGLANGDEVFHDYKTNFQEFIQKEGESKIVYKVLAEKGPDHNKTFLVQLFLNDTLISEGEGKSKKEAEQNAAKTALVKLQ